MLDYSECDLDKLSVHHTGNKSQDGQLILSKSQLNIRDEKLHELLKKFFLHPFTTPEYHSFSFSNGDFTLNPIYHFANDIFSGNTAFHLVSVNIARQLFDCSSHPQIKPGDLFVAFFNDLIVEGEYCEAIGIFKSENRHAFLKLDNQEEGFVLNYEDGINIEKLDKGCLIFNMDKETGYKVAVIDKSNKSAEAQYWTDDFLNLSPCRDGFHHTKQFMDLTKEFVTNGMMEEFEVNKTNQIDMLNRSVNFFKTHEVFEKKNFEMEVLVDPEIIGSFRNFDKKYQQNHEIQIDEQFEIHDQAVKKQARFFKSVLKLDKNFHVYIHGNPNLIEQGMEADGRKYYKLYYTDES